MTAVIVAIHVIVCIGLIFLILIQQGRGGGLIEGLSSAESLLGTKTSSFLSKTTSGLAVTFFVTCLLLAVLSVHQSRSVVDRIDLTSQAESPKAESVKDTGAAQEEAQQEAVETQTQTSETATETQ